MNWTNTIPGIEQRNIFIKKMYTLNYVFILWNYCQSTKIDVDWTRDLEFTINDLQKVFVIYFTVIFVSDNPRVIQFKNYSTSEIY